MRAWVPCIAVVVAALATSRPVTALETRCVDTPAELSGAFVQSEDDDVRINIVQGSYDIRNTNLNSIADHDIDAAVTIVGGYTDDSCSDRDPDPALTVLFGDANTFVRIHEGGEITLRSLTFRDLASVLLSPVDTSPNTISEHDLRLERVRFERVDFVRVFAIHAYLQSVAMVDAAGVATCAMSFDNNLVGLERLQIENSLFTGLGGHAVCVGDRGDEDWGTASIENSIFWNNSSEDLFFRSEGTVDLALRNNIIDRSNISPPSTITAFATLDADPQFVNPASGDFRLQITSPAKDSGTSNLSSGVPATDIAGLPRVVAGIIDRGPHESQSSAASFNYTVTNTLNAGAGSLRQAMLDAEATAGLNGILFNIPGAGCPKVITLTEPLPPVTQDLVIDGVSQPGSARSNSETRFNADICVVLQSGAGLSPDNGLVVDDAPATASLAVVGLGFSGFGGAAIDLRDGGDHRVFGSQFGGNAGAVALQENNFGVRVSRTTSPNLSGVQIGGEEVSQRNLIGNSNVAGVVLNGAFVRDTLVVNNFIGLAADGSGALPNQFGVLNTSAIDTTLRDNWISGNSSDGVFLNTSMSFLQGNRIGLRAVAGGTILNPDLDRGNGGYGVRINYTAGGLSGNVVGSGVAYQFGLPVPTGSGNVIAYNDEGGIRAEGGLGHRLSRDLVYANDGLQIDIAEVGVTLNDNDSGAGADARANRGLNTPELTAATGGSGSGSVSGTLASRNGTYRIEVFSNTVCGGGLFPQGQARVYHGAGVVSIANATPSQDGSASFTVPVASNTSAPQLANGRGFVAIAIDADGNTSELSVCRPYVVDSPLLQDGFESP